MLNRRSAIGRSHAGADTRDSPPQRTQGTRWPVQELQASASTVVEMRSTARQRIERRPLDAHPPMPLMKLFEQVGIHLEQIQRRGIGHPRGFHETEEQEEIVQLRRLFPQFPLVTA